MLLGALSEACGEHVPLRGARLPWLLCLKEKITTQLRFLKTCKFWSLEGTNDPVCVS